MMMQHTKGTILRRRLGRALAQPGVRGAAALGGWFLGGFLLSAASLSGSAMPIALGLLCACRGGWSAAAAALGGSAGYLWFWGGGGWQGVSWMLGGLAVSLTLGDRDICRRQSLLLPSCSAVIVAGSGCVFLFRYGESVPVSVHLLRVVLALGATLLFRRWIEKSGSWADWLCQGLLTLALANVAVFGLNLGLLAAGYLGADGALASAVMAGLGLDLARATAAPMTGALCLGFCLRLIPGRPRWVDALAPALAYVTLALLNGSTDLSPLPGLLLGGGLRMVLPGLGNIRPKHRRGETAVAQLRLEQMSSALRQMEQSLLLTAPPRLDRAAVLERCRSAACDLCPERRGCRARYEELPEDLLEQPGLGEEDLSKCRKPQRLLTELRRGQEQLRRMKGDRRRLESYQWAAREQYAFLADFLQSLSEELGSRSDWRPPRFRAEVALSTHSRQQENGDRCLWFPGTGNQYYVLLCDGMGTGAGAAGESASAAKLLRQMLTAGLPAEYALRSLNSLAVLRDLGGCTTVDLVRLQLDTGRGTLYKWGAASSYLLKNGQLRKIGTAGPPPGLSQQARETVDRLSLGGGEVLILLSDGAGEDMLLRTQWTAREPSPGEMAAAILASGGGEEDDATVAVIRLCSSDASA